MATKRFVYSMTSRTFGADFSAGASAAKAASDREEAAQAKKEPYRAHDAFPGDVRLRVIDAKA
jgi:hypothetical protein